MIRMAKPFSQPGLIRTNKLLKLAFQVSKEEKAVVGYNGAVLG